MKGTTIIRELLKRNLIKIDDLGYYHTTPKSSHLTAVRIYGRVTTLRRWIYYSIYNEFPTNNLITYDTSDLIDWRLNNEF